MEYNPTNWDFKELDNYGGYPLGYPAKDCNNNIIPGMTENGYLIGILICEINKPDSTGFRKTCD